MSTSESTTAKTATQKQTNCVAQLVGREKLARARTPVSRQRRAAARAHRLTRGCSARAVGEGYPRASGKASNRNNRREQRERARALGPTSRAENVITAREAECDAQQAAPRAGALRKAGQRGRGNVSGDDDRVLPVPVVRDGRAEALHGLLLHPPTGTEVHHRGSLQPRRVAAGVNTVRSQKASQRDPFRTAWGGDAATSLLTFCTAVRLSAPQRGPHGEDHLLPHGKMRQDSPGSPTNAVGGAPRESGPEQQSCLPLEQGSRRVLASACGAGCAGVPERASAQRPLTRNSGFPSFKVRFHPRNSAVLASGSLDHEVRVWNATNAVCLAVQDFGAIPRRSAGIKDRKLLRNGSLRPAPAIAGRPISSLAFHMEEDVLAVASAEKVSPASPEHISQPHASTPAGLDITPRGHWSDVISLLRAPNHPQLLLWDYSAASVTGNPKGEIRQAIGAKRALRAVQFHPRNSRMLLTAEVRPRPRVPHSP